MTAFTLLSVDDNDNPVEYPGTIDTAAKTVTVKVPYAAIVTDCTARVEHTGTAIAPDPAEPREYLPGEPGELEEEDVVRYTLTAASGSTAVYTVTVQQLSGIATLKQFEIAGLAEHPEYALTPLFVPDTAEPHEFSLIVDESVTSLTLIAAATDGTNGVVDQPSQIIDLASVRTARAEVTVTSEDGTKTVTYSLAIKKGVPPITYTVGTTSFKMNFVPNGKFSRDEGDVNISIISQAMRMGETEVTRALYHEVMSKYYDTSTNTWATDPGYTGASNDNTQPIEAMCFYYAIVFCNKLSLRLGKTPVYEVAGIGLDDWKAMKRADIPAASASTPTLPDAWRDVTMDTSKDGFRLPTEMEFIWACIGADDLTPGELIKPVIADTWAGKELGLTMAQCARWTNNDANAPGGLSLGPVATLAPNALGIYDMSGNRGEIVWDRSNAGNNRTPWPTGTLTDYAGESLTDAGTNNRMIKGGSGSQSAGNVKNLYFCDSSNPPNNARYSGNGFRIASKN